MIVVVADTSSLNYLIQTDSDHVLPALYEHVLVPSSVVGELGHPRSVAAVRAWLTRMPSWLATDFRCSPSVLEEARRHVKFST